MKDATDWQIEGISKEEIISWPSNIGRIGATPDMMGRGSMNIFHSCIELGVACCSAIISVTISMHPMCSCEPDVHK